MVSDSKEYIKFKYGIKWLFKKENKGNICEWICLFLIV